MPETPPKIHPGGEKMGSFMLDIGMGYLLLDEVGGRTLSLDD